MWPDDTDALIALQDSLAAAPGPGFSFDPTAPIGACYVCFARGGTGSGAAGDPAWAQKQVRSWQMRAHRLEPALAFWNDLLRQLGLLGTVLGLGLSLAYTGKDVSKLLDPLALAVWTTVAGLAYSIWLSAIFGMKLTAWVDACEKNLEAWDARRRSRVRPGTERGVGAR